MKRIILFAITALAATLCGCTDFLSPDMTNQVDEKLMFSKPEYAQTYLDDFYRYLPVYSPFDTGDSPVGLTEGMTDTFKYSSTVPGTHVGFANLFVMGHVGYGAPTVDYNLGAWSATYDRIRRVNEFIYLMNKQATFDTATIEKFTAQARFIRAFLYWQLLKRMDQVIIMEEDLTKIAKDKALSTNEECWNYVEADLDYAAQVLSNVVWGSQDAGRITAGAAYAFKSRAMLYAKRWASAKAAAEEVFKMGYELMDGSTGANYNKAFTSAAAGNTESILEFNYTTTGPSHNFDRRFSPRGDGDATIPGDGVASPTQEMVECYEYAGGGPVDWTPWHTAVGTTETPPYALLEPRFHASILYNNAPWKGRTIESFVGGRDGYVEYSFSETPLGRSTTGYYLRKLVDESHLSFVSTSPSTQPAVIIRLAEVLLNHAEACAMSTDETGANASLRKVRARVGLPHTDLSGDALMNAIRKERKVELSFEGHLYWDMNRWRLSEAAYSGQGSRVHGLRIEKNATTGVLTYYYVDCDKMDRLFMSKLYRVPLPETEVRNNNLVDQFPEWL
jgi:hypothetical protein